MSETSEDGACDPVEWFSLASTISIAVGIVLVAFGLLVPTHYTFDANLSARQMESIEIFYFRLSEGLVICLIIGMALVTLGGVMQTGIILHMYRNGELDPRPPRSTRRSHGSEMTALWRAPSDGRNYGTRDSMVGDSGKVEERPAAANDVPKTPELQGYEGTTSLSDAVLQRQQPR